MPFDWPLVLLTAVDEDETDDVEEMEEEELFRGIVFRGISTPLTSSEFIELRDWPPLSPHAGRLMLAKLGGLATAVMRKGWSVRPTLAEWWSGDVKSRASR